jgi:hypothetical protein
VNGRRHPLRALLARCSGRGTALRGGAGFTMVETLMALTIFLVIGTTLAGTLTSATAAHKLARGRSLAQQAAQTQIEQIRALQYSDIGTNPGNPTGTVQPSQAISLMGLHGTLTTKITYVKDPVPTSYNQSTNYKQIAVTVTSLDGKQLAREVTLVSPPTKAQAGGINQVAISVQVIDIGNNTPLANVPIALQTGPSAPLSDTTDSTGSVTFAGLTANPTSGSQAYYDVAATLPAGYVELSSDVTQTQLAPGQQETLILSVYQPATIYVNLTQNGNPYTGGATLTVTPPSGPAQNYTVASGSSSATIANQIPGQYTISASAAGGSLINNGVTQTVPSSYPSDLTSTFAMPLIAPTGTIKVTATQGGSPLAGSTVTVTGGPSSVNVSGVTDASGILSFAGLTAGAGYTVKLTSGAQTVQQTNVSVVGNTTTNVPLAVTVGSIKVTVTQGVALAGATVTLNGPSSYAASGTTNGSGQYTFTNVPAGTGYTVSTTSGAATATSPSQTVTSGATTNVTLALPVGSIQVTVTKGGSALSGQAVSLSGPNSFSASANTNGSGVATFSNVPAGSGYTVSTTSGAQTVSQDVTVTSGGTAPATLAIPAGSVQVTVTKGGSPFSGQTVSLSGPSSYSASGTTNGSGVVTFSNVPAGSGYTVSTTLGSQTASQNVTVTSGGTATASLDIPVGSIKVTVTQGAALAGATVSVTGPNSFSASGTTDGSGVVTFSDVPAGSGYTASTTSYGQTVQGSATVTSGATSNVSLAIPAGSVQVTVTKGGSAFSGQTVSLTGPSSYSTSGTTNGSGVVTFSNVPAAAGYTVSTSFGASTPSQAVTVTSGGTATATLAISLGSIKATVKNQSGTALSGVTVTLSGPNSYSDSGTTDGSGNYTFSNVPAGSGYTVKATYGTATVTSSSQSVSSGSTTNVSLTLQMGTLSVTVKKRPFSFCSTVSGATVTVWGGPTSIPSGSPLSATSNSSGVATFTNVVPGGSYSIKAVSGSLNNTLTSQTVNVGPGTTSITITIQGTACS